MTPSATSDADRVRWSLVKESLNRPYPVTFSMVALVSLVPLYLLIADVARSRTPHAPELALDRVVPLQATGCCTLLSQLLDSGGPLGRPSGAPVATLSTLALSRPSVPSGGTSTRTVRLTAPAPAGGAEVLLASSDTSAATVPASMTVAEVNP